MYSLGYPTTAIGERFGVPRERIEQDISRVERSLARFKYPDVAAHSHLEYTKHIGVTLPSDELKRIGSEIQSLWQKEIGDKR